MIGMPVQSKLDVPTFVASNPLLLWTGMAQRLLQLLKGALLLL